MNTTLCITGKADMNIDAFVRALMKEGYSLRVGDVTTARGISMAHMWLDDRVPAPILQTDRDVTPPDITKLGRRIGALLGETCPGCISFVIYSCFIQKLTTTPLANGTTNLATSIADVSYHAIMASSEPSSAWKRLLDEEIG